MRQAAAVLAPMSDDMLVSVDKVSKKFCRRLKTSLAYGLRDMTSDLFGFQRNGSELRDEEFWAVDNVSFTLRRGESVGLVGANGAGKTTLLKMLSGLLKPDDGIIRIRGRMAPLIALGAGFKPVLSGRENVYVNLSILGVPMKKIESMFNDIVEFSELGEAIDAPLQTYSSGMAARLGFSCAIHTEPDILLIDEVLAVGDIRFRAKCYRRLADLRRRGTAFVLVSHSPVAILGSCEQCMYMQKGKVVLAGPAPEVIRRYEEDLRGVTAPAPGQAGMKAAAQAFAVDGFKMEEICFTDGSGQRVESPGSGARVHFRIRCFCFREFSRVKTTLIVREAFGDLQTILTLSSGDFPISLPIGRNEIVLEFPFLGLQSGLYTMKIGLTTDKLDHLAATESFRFYVSRNHQTEHSLFYQPCEWRVVSEKTTSGAAVLHGGDEG